MKVAISAQGSRIDSLVDPRFGRAAWFIIADQDSLGWSALDNAENKVSRGGSGAQSSTLVTEQAIQAVITGNVGPNALKMLTAAGIRTFQAENGVTVQQALARLKANDLSVLDAPTVAGHWS